MDSLERLEGRFVVLGRFVEGLEDGTLEVLAFLRGLGSWTFLERPSFRCGGNLSTICVGLEEVGFEDFETGEEGVGRLRSFFIVMVGTEEGGGEGLGTRFLVILKAKESLGYIGNSGKTALCKSGIRSRRGLRFSPPN